MPSQVSLGGYNSNIDKEEAGRSRAQGEPQSHRELEAILSYLKSCLRKYYPSLVKHLNALCASSTILPVDRFRIMFLKVLNLLLKH